MSRPHAEPRQEAFLPLSALEEAEQRRARRRPAQPLPSHVLEEWAGHRTEAHET